MEDKVIPNLFPLLLWTELAVLVWVEHIHPPALAKGGEGCIKKSAMGELTEEPGWLAPVNHSN